MFYYSPKHKTKNVKDWGVLQPKGCFLNQILYYQRQFRNIYFLKMSKNCLVLFCRLLFQTSLAMEVAQNGDIANWKIPGKMVKGMGGAMDLVASAENIVVAMMHTNKAGVSKLLRQCTLPITGVQCVKRVVTNLAVLDIDERGFVLRERAPGVSVEEIQAATEGTLVIEGDVPEMQLD